jgi:hypothetical protein
MSHTRKHGDTGEAIRSGREFNGNGREQTLKAKEWAQDLTHSRFAVSN